MEEQKIVKKGLTYPAFVKGMDYIEYQAIWLMKKKIRKMPIEEIEKYRKKYQKYIDAYDAELKNRENVENEKIAKEQEEEMELYEKLRTKYNKTTL